MHPALRATASNLGLTRFANVKLQQESIPMARFCNKAVLIMFVGLCSRLAMPQVGKNSDLDGILGRFPGYHLLTLRELDSAE
jgi:hypothetical protein